MANANFPRQNLCGIMPELLPIHFESTADQLGSIPDGPCKSSCFNLLAIALILGIHTVLIGGLAMTQSPSNDELGHLVAGLSHWKLQRFDLFAVNPPLVRTVAAIPVALANFQENWTRYEGDVQARSEYSVGMSFVEANPMIFTRAFKMARWMCIPFSLLGAMTCYLWAGELYGQKSAWVALFLWCTCPNILGYASAITPDVGATSEESERGRSSFDRYGAVDIMVRCPDAHESVLLECASTF